MKKYARYLITVILAAALLTGCGAGNKMESSVATADSAAAEEVMEEEAAEMEYAASTSMGYEFANGASESGGTSGESAGSENNVLSTRKLIKTVFMSVETLEFDSFLDQLEAKVESLGGYVESSSVSGNGYNYDRYRYASMTLRIPSQKLDGFISGISEMCSVTYKDESVEDITLQYVDVESHKKALEVEQERLMSLLEKADSVEDIITIETRLSEVRYELESYESRLRTYDNQVNYSTVTMDISEVERTTPAAEKTAWDRIKNGVGESIYDILRDGKNFVIGFIIDIPYFIVWAIILFLLYKLVKIIYHKVLKRDTTIIKEKKSVFRRKKDTDVQTEDSDKEK